ncbi:calcium-permeable channel component Mid1 [Brevipalpus obovatus]|uniref:calcium-permeable channel component Mid1 n=1 Tax=Brevipalpus obovatus TaxID=246614 RepID=UPI003D9F9C16
MNLFPHSMMIIPSMTNRAINHINLAALNISTVVVLTFQIVLLCANPSIPTSLTEFAKIHKDNHDSNSSSSLFKHHCSPWIDQRILSKLQPKQKRLLCHFDQSSVVTTNNQDSSHERSQKALNFAASSPSATMVKENGVNNSQRASNEPYSPHPDENESWGSIRNNPQRMTDNFSPPLCHYTASNNNQTFNELREYLQLMRSYNMECLSLNNESIASICQYSKPKDRIDQIKRYCLSFCDKYTLSNVLSDDSWAKLMSNNQSICIETLQELHLIDKLASKIVCKFNDILSRYQCRGYSRKTDCNQCKKAYKDWVCSLTLPYYLDGFYIKPCRTFCEKVEQKCPHLHSALTYAGEPVFICIDPEISYFQNSTNIPYGSPDECYQSCHLTSGTREAPDMETERDHICPDPESFIPRLAMKHSKEEFSDEPSSYDVNLSEKSPEVARVDDAVNSNHLLDDELVVDLPREHHGKIDSQSLNEDFTINLTTIVVSEANESGSYMGVGSSVVNNVGDLRPDRGQDGNDNLVTESSLDNSISTGNANMNWIHHKTKRSTSDKQASESISYLPIDDDGSEDEGGR